MITLDCIEGLGGMYGINDRGAIFSVRKQKNLIPTTSKSGHLIVYLSYLIGGGIWCKVHRLVARQFIPNPDNHRDINIKNGLKCDVSVENLTWMCHSENIKYGYASLGRVHNGSGSRKVVYCETNGRTYKSGVDAAVDTDCRASNISMCCNGKIKHTKGYKFRYE